MLTYTQIIGDEPLYDNDAGSASALAKYIGQMRQEFTSAGLDIPISISDMAYGWKQAGDISSMVEAVDFFMINNFPYFAGNAQTGGSDQAWSDFTSDVKYFQGIANGKPLLVTQVRYDSSLCSCYLDIIFCGINGFTDLLMYVDWLA